MRKGYTLVELLGVLVVLGIIATITTVVLTNVVKNANDTLDEDTKLLLYTAAERYLVDNVNLSSNGNYNVSLGTLMSKDLISKTFVENQGNTRITSSSCVRVSITGGKMNYSFDYTC